MGFGLFGWDLGLKARIWASTFKAQNGALRLGLGPKGLDWGLNAKIKALRMGFKPQVWDLGLKDEIWALRMRFGPRG